MKVRGGNSQYVSVVNLSIVSCFSFEFFFPIAHLSRSTPFSLTFCRLFIERVKGDGDTWALETTLIDYKLKNGVDTPNHFLFRFYRFYDLQYKQVWGLCILKGANIIIII